MKGSITIGELIGASEAPFVVADRGPVRFIVMNQPATRNALTRQMRRDFSQILMEADASEDIAVVILTGAPPVFSAGVDLKERALAGPAPQIRPNPGEALRAAKKPVIAAVNGACATGALEMALSCSFVIASDEARFADTHVKVGLMPRWGQLSLLSRAVGVRRARQMIATGEFIDAHTAVCWGIASERVPVERLLDRSLELAERIAAGDARVLGLCLSALASGEVAASAELEEAEQAALGVYDSGRN